MKKQFFMSLLVVLCGVFAAQAQGISRLDVEVRSDWQFEALEGVKQPEASGFDGKFFNLRLDGSLAENLTYSIRYRANKVQSSPFAATDWATLTYSTDKWDFSAGKQVVAIGGYEYDRAPIDIYFASEYWHQIACYQFGVSATYKYGNTKLLGQVCRSPYDFANQNLYAYNLMVMNAHTLSSINLLEYAPGKFAGYIALGDREVFGDVAVEWDLMYRNDLENLKNNSSMSAMVDVNWAMNEKLNIFTHASWDFNDGSMAMVEPTVLPGTDIWRVGGGVEYFPTGKKNLRIHAASCYTLGKSVPSAALQNGHFMFQAGLTWKVNLLNKN